MSKENYTLVCSVCQSDFVRMGTRGRAPKMCPDCRKEALRAYQREREKTRVRPKRVRKRKPTRLVCQHCFLTVEREIKGSRDAGKYCSRECGFARKSLVSVERNALRRIAKLNRDALKAKYALPDLVKQEIQALRRIEGNVRRRSIPASCSGCSKEFIRTYKYQRFCTLYCRDESKDRARKRERRSESYRISKRKYRAKRRAIERGSRAQSIDPIKVFERDKWKCHLCGVRTLKSKRGTFHDRAPELEHIVSLADGGTHTWGNVACSCRKCNLDKGSRSSGQIGFDWAA